MSGALSSVVLLTKVFELFASKIVDEGVNRIGRRYDVSDLVEDLRFIRFNDDGVRSLLRASSRNDEDSANPRVLRDFSDADTRVNEILNRLVRELGIVSRITNRELEQIRHNKLQVRLKTFELAIDYDQPGYAMNKMKRQKISKLVSAIEKMNSAIDKVEDKLMHGNQSR